MGNEYGYTKVSDIRADVAELKYLIFLYGQLLASKAYDVPAGFTIESKRTMAGYLNIIKSFDAVVSVMADSTYITWKTSNLSMLEFKKLNDQNYREDFLDKAQEWVAQIWQLVDRKMNLVPARDATIVMGADNQDEGDEDEEDEEDD